MATMTTEDMPDCWTFSEGHGLCDLRQGELQALHLAIVKEMSSRFGPEAAVRMLGTGMMEMSFDSPSLQQIKPDAAAQPAKLLSQPLSPFAPETPGGRGCKAPSLSSSQLSAESSDSPSVETSPRAGALGPVRTKSSGLARLQSRWQQVQDIIVQEDKWEARGVHLQPLSKGVRRRWNPREAVWHDDEDVLVKMDTVPFGAGAMRECFAMKKLSSHTNNSDWKRAQNLVAKRYMRPVEPEVYYEDVILQMDAKMLGEEYNKCHPPKKVDFIAAQLYEIHTSARQGLYCVESLIEGDYLKYNNNSGFVEEEDYRNTPQAFSHWTFCHTSGRKLVVDIQGVGDLYTDPQIHSADGKGYGTGNLGPRGMALFFRGHECNAICQQLKLAPFPRCTADVKACVSRSSSLASSRSLRAFQAQTLTRMPEVSEAELMALQERVDNMNHIQSDVTPMLSKAWQLETARAASFNSCSPQAKVHLELAKMHGEAVVLPENFPHTSTIDSLEGVFYHLLKAAMACGRMACLVMARIYSGLDPTMTVFKAAVDYAKQIPDTYSLAPDPELALVYAKIAAYNGVRGAMLFVAGTLAAQDGAKQSNALIWYKKALEANQSEFHDPTYVQGREELSKQLEDEASALPGAKMVDYEIYAAIADIYRVGCSDVQRDPAIASEYYESAADAATNAMKGKLAAKYYELSAMAASEAEEEEEAMEGQE